MPYKSTEAKRAYHRRYYRECDGAERRAKKRLDYKVLTGAGLRYRICADGKRRWVIGDDRGSDPADSS